ncbi:hypothetical protein GL305_25240 [Nocardia seriolae]|nr:hypothetical protein NS506_05566 [Nocardia seriolae]MTJ64188.1 hypothetical protein [Nocardia seriolae]MTJ73157.1 hypothetical protein [Nocardia seriolae]MTJ89182.1 hypothetical protein [Nocardia seriolae]MTK33160.1 hypothetical protein [Nocardia seriolae]
MFDTSALREAYRALLEAAATVADSDRTVPPAPGEWDADRILAHVSLITAATIATAARVTAGEHARYDNRVALDTWTIDRVIERAGGQRDLCERLRHQAEILCGFGSAALSGPELDTLVPTRLLSAGTLLVDQPLPLRDLFQGLIDEEIPGHTRQLLALLPERAAEVAR